MTDDMSKADQDGISHCNVFSRSRDPLGRWLSHFTRAEFTCPDGKFASIEGFWYWLQVDESEPQRNRLRTSYGYAAKELGRELRAISPGPYRTDHQAKVREAHRLRLLAHPEWLKAFVESTLPFQHYYATGDRVTTPKGSAWLGPFLEELREDLRGQGTQHVDVVDSTI